MHTSNLWCLVGLCSVFAQALTIPKHDGALLRRDGWSADVPIEADIFKRIDLAKPKPGEKPAAKPAPAVKPPAKPTPKVTPTPSATPIVPPNVKVPYVTTAFDTCGIFVECDESQVEAENLVARAITVTHDVRGEPTQTPAPAFARRDVRTYKPSAAKVTIKNLDYPGARDLFSTPKGGAKVETNVFDYNSFNVVDYKVKNLKKEPTSYDDYVTEHVVELQTVMMFINFATAKDARLKGFFETWWNKELDPTTVENRPNKPSFTTVVNQKSINDLVFEALGSNNNRKDFVLCQAEINGYKARIWSSVSPMEIRKYNRIVREAVSGASNSNEYLSALRSTLAVFEYLKDPEVTSRLQASVKNVGTELKNVEHLTKEKFNLAAGWETFMKSHLTNVETEAKKWIDQRVTDAEGAILRALKTLNTAKTKLEKTEKGKTKAKHERTTEAASDKLDAEIMAAEAAVEAQEQVVKTKEANLEAKREVSKEKTSKLREKIKELDTVEESIKRNNGQKLVDLNKQKVILEADKTKFETEKNTAEIEKKAAESARATARRAKLKKEKTVGLKQRKKWLLRSAWIQEVIDHFEADQRILATFKTAGAAIKMPAAV